MTSVDKSETLDQLCEEAYKKKNATNYTSWAEFWENIIWDHFIILILLHVGFFGSFFMYGFGLHPVPVKPWTIAWMFFLSPVTFFGTSAGAHRLWAHRSYKANLPLRILLMVLYSGLGIYTIFDWVKDHRVHHKYVETDADPHNAKRGFFYSHFGWLVLKRHPECTLRNKETDMTDLKADGVVMFQKRHKNELNALFCFILPTLVPIIFWGENIVHATLTQCFIRYLLTLHCLWSVNSVAHLWGNRPYNKLINPTDNFLICLITSGEGSHNYHHTFPWDYKTSEFPYVNFGLTTFWINLFSKIGWAFDLRQPSPQFIEKVVERIGHKSGITSQHDEFPLGQIIRTISPLHNDHSSLLKFRKRCFG